MMPGQTGKMSRMQPMPNMSLIRRRLLTRQRENSRPRMPTRITCKHVTAVKMHAYRMVARFL